MLTEKDLTIGHSYTAEEIVVLRKLSKLEKYHTWREYLAKKPGLGGLANPRGLYMIFLNEVYYGRELILEELRNNDGYLATKFASFDALKDVLVTATNMSRAVGRLNDDNLSTLSYSETF